MNTSNPKPIYFFLVLLLSVSIWTGCSEEESEPMPDISNLGILDLGNTESSADIFIRYKLSFFPDVFRLAVVPESSFTSFSVNEAKDLDASKYMEVNDTELANSFYLNDVFDINGDVITNGNSYRVYFIFINNESIQLSSDFAEVELTSDNPYLGEYKGTWNDNINTGILISVRLLTSIENTLRGEFFATGTFVPYNDGASVGATNDGAIKLVLNETGEIDLFEYNQQLLTYMNGCSGYYSGTGTFTDLTFSIDYTGDDCDGYHEGGKIQLTRLY